MEKDGVGSYNNTRDWTETIDPSVKSEAKKKMS